MKHLNKGGIYWQVPKEADLSWFASTIDIRLMWKGGTQGKQKHMKCRLPALGGSSSNVDMWNHSKVVNVIKMCNVSRKMDVFWGGVQCWTSKVDKFDSAQNRLFCFGQMDLRIVLRKAENIQNWPCWTVSMVFRLEWFFRVKFQLLFAPCGVNLS